MASDILEVVCFHRILSVLFPRAAIDFIILSRRHVHTLCPYSCHHKLTTDANVRGARGVPAAVVEVKSGTMTTINVLAKT